MNIGTIVKCRNREWVLIPSDNPEVYLLRPLAGSPDEVTAIHKRLADLVGYDLPSERITPASFPLPDPEDVKDAKSCQLFWQATRLSLRDGATPFRSLGRISIRPRIYQFVPLLMALRLEPIRLFIADDVGVGKTIEALLVARELWDRREIRSFCVLCPPYLCEQWEKEIKEKFNLEVVVIRSGTISQLERKLIPGKNVYEQYPIQVISIDWVKSDKNKHLFLQFCPELVIVDEVHGAAEAPNNKNQQQRHELLKEIASKNPERHLIFLTATPHSGIPQAFQSLLSLLNREFNNVNLSELSEQEREKLAKHFVQRTRKDIEKSWEEAERIFPERITKDETYELSPEYLDLFKKTYEFCFEIVSSAQDLEIRKQRMRYWGALALLRCVMSSPKAAEVAFTIRLSKEDSDEEADYQKFIYEPTAEFPDDENPIPPIEDTEATLDDNEKAKLAKLKKLALNILKNKRDNKLIKCIEIVENLINEKYNPIIWCRYVATAEYVGEHLKEILGDRVQVITIHGRIPDDERKAKIDEINTDLPRVLVATDCLSEGINLQEKFTAVIHYDLPWNPNRLEQREGRVDRYGQDPTRKVKAIRFYGKNNPVDGAIIRVLLDKAEEIRKTLGTYVPVPEESESLMMALINALFFKRRILTDIKQLELGLDIPEVIDFQNKWTNDSIREKENRSRFAQKAIKLDEVKKEIELTDSVLGNPDEVKSFVLEMLQRIGIDFNRSNDGCFYSINLSSAHQERIPELIRKALPSIKGRYWKISFISPTPVGAEYLGRNHPFVSSLAQYAMEEALRSSSMPGQADKPISRCGVIRTSSVNRLTTLLLLRIRYLFRFPDKEPLLSEEVLVTGFYKSQDRNVEWLTKEEALNLLEKASPHENIPYEEKKELVNLALSELGNWSIDSSSWGEGHPLKESILYQINERAYELKESQKRIRQAVHLKVRDLKVKPQLPPDLLGILVLQPVVKR